MDEKKNEALKAFAEAAKTDEALATEVRAAIEAKDTAELARLATEHGFEINAADFEQRVPASPEGAELSEEELAAVAGGQSCDEFFAYLTCIAMFGADWW